MHAGTHVVREGQERAFEVTLHKVIRVAAGGEQGLKVIEFGFHWCMLTAQQVLHTSKRKAHAWPVCACSEGDVSWNSNWNLSTLKCPRRWREANAKDAQVCKLASMKCGHNRRARIHSPYS
eukprot:375236-Pelagomonas_calceolata.AAC.1